MARHRPLLPLPPRLAATLACRHSSPYDFDVGTNLVLTWRTTRWPRSAFCLPCFDPAPPLVDACHARPTAAIQRSRRRCRTISSARRPDPPACGALRPAGRRRAGPVFPYARPARSAKPNGWISLAKWPVRPDADNGRPGFGPSLCGRIGPPAPGRGAGRLLGIANRARVGGSSLLLRTSPTPLARCRACCPGGGKHVQDRSPNPYNASPPAFGWRRCPPRNFPRGR